MLSEIGRVVVTVAEPPEMAGVLRLKLKDGDDTEGSSWLAMPSSASRSRR